MVSGIEWVTNTSGPSAAACAGVEPVRAASSVYASTTASAFASMKPGVWK